MLKHKVACWFATAAVSSCLTMAQNSQAHLSSEKSAPDPLKTVTKPLAEKSATTPVHHKSSSVLPPTSAGSANTGTELSRIEGEKVSTKGRANEGSGALKNTSTSKTAHAPGDTGPGINYKYQKPAGGTQANTPNAHMPNSSVPRVKKN
jgi:hypothetical protein